MAITNLRFVCKTITCASAFTKWPFFLEIILYNKRCCTLRCRLRERCHCGRLPSHYRRARTQDYLACWTRTRHDFSLTCHSVQRARQPLSRRAISRSSFTVAGGSSSFVSKVLGANCKRANMLTTLILWLINSPCELTGSNL